MVWLRLWWVGLGAALCAAGCSRPEPAAPATRAAAAPALRKVVLQTDWFPQAEHGGFYQALAKGYYRQVGLEVEILPGGPGAGIKLKVAKGDADFGLNRSDDAIVAASHGLPLVIVAAVFQHDPQALLVHDASPVRTAKDLAGATITAAPGMTWIPYLQKKHGITFNVRPHTYGMAGFFADPEAVQQCLVTNEPYYAEEKGVKVRTVAISDATYDCYHTIICRRELLLTSPAVVRAFVAASLRGWRDYLESDPEPAHALIRQRNPEMPEGLLTFSRGEIVSRALVSGDAAQGERMGGLSLARLADQRDVLVDLKIIDTPVAVNAFATLEFLPPVQR